MKWVPAASWVASDSGLPSPGGSSQDMLTTSFQRITVEEGAVDQGSTTVKANPHSEDSLGTSQSQLGNGEVGDDTYESKLINLSHC